MENNTTASQGECETYTVEQAAKILGIGRNLAYDAVKRGDIRLLKIPGSRARVPRSEVGRLLNGVPARNPQA
jgi:excisionase family DNA binding protein